MKKLMTKNTGVILLLEDADWEKVKDVALYEFEGKIITRTRTTLEEYLGIKGIRISSAPKYNFFRCYYYEDFEIPKEVLRPI